MHGGSKGFHKRYIMIIQGGLKKALFTENNCLVCMTIQSIVCREQPKFWAKIATQYETLIMKEKCRNKLEYIYISLKISPVMLYKIVLVTFSQYLPHQAPKVIVFLNFESKLDLCWQWLEQFSKTKTKILIFERESYTIHVKTMCLVTR